MANVEPASRIVLDPSFLFTEDAISWLDDPNARPSLVISESLRAAVDEANLDFLAEPYGLDLQAIDLPYFQAVLVGIDTFSARDADLPSGEAWELLSRLTEGDAPTTALIADEYAFIASQSLGAVINEYGFTLRQWEAAGVTLYRVNRANMLAGLGRFRNRLPPRLLSVTKAISNFPRGRAAKFVIAGGAIGVSLIPYVGLPLAIAGAVRAGTAFIVGDP